MVNVPQHICFPIAHMVDATSSQCVGWWRSSHLHTWCMQRKSWGGDDDCCFASCTHGRCYNSSHVGFWGWWRCLATCTHGRCVYQSGKGLLYFTDTILVDKVDNCTSSYNSFTNIEKGRMKVFFSVLPTSQSKIAKSELRHPVLEGFLHVGKNSESKKNVELPMILIWPMLPECKLPGVRNNAGTMFIHFILIDILYQMLQRVPILHDFSPFPLTSASTWRWRKFTSWLWYYCIILHRFSSWELAGYYLRRQGCTETGWSSATDGTCDFLSRFERDRVIEG